MVRLISVIVVSIIVVRLRNSMFIRCFFFLVSLMFISLRCVCRRLMVELMRWCSGF